MSDTAEGRRDLALLEEIEWMAYSRNHTSPYKYVLLNGRFFTSQRFPAIYGNCKRTPKQGFDNAFKLAKRHPELRYAEGHGLTWMGLVTLHAWCVDPDLRVVDPTRRNQGRYYGVTYDLEFVQKVRERTGMDSVIDNWTEAFPLLRNISPETYLRDVSEGLANQQQR